MTVTYFPDCCDVFGETHAMIDVECLVVLYVLYDLWGVKIDEDCVLFDLEPVHLYEWVGVLLQALERF